MTPEAANAFLPLFIADYNRRFTRPPADPTPAWRRPPRDLPLVLSCRYTRTVARDNTVTSVRARCSSRPVPAGAPGPALASSSGNAWTVAWWPWPTAGLSPPCRLPARISALAPRRPASSDRRNPAQRPAPCRSRGPRSPLRAVPHLGAGSTLAALEPSVTSAARTAPARPGGGHSVAQARTKKAHALTPSGDDIFMLQLTRHFHVAATGPAGTTEDALGQSSREGTETRSGWQSGERKKIAARARAVDSAGDRRRIGE